MLLMLSLRALAQEPLPLVAPFTLDVKRTPSGFSKKDKEELQKLFPMLVRGADAAVPESAKLSSALSDLKRQDCEREDACLSQLAKLAGALYGLYVSVDYNTEKHVVAVGRVVRDDGVSMGPAQTVDLSRTNAPFKDIARDALGQVLTKLAVGKLSPFRPAAAVVSEQPTVVVKEPAEDPLRADVPPPPPPPIVTQPRELDLKTPGYVLLGVGGGVAIGGVLVFALANPRVDANGVIERGSSTPAEAVEAYKAARNQQTIGLVMTGVGAAAVATGLVLTLLPPKQSVVVTAAPTAGGAMFSVGGVFP